jgi:hypothetical protein
MEVTLKLLGFRGFPEVENALTDGALALCLRDDATLDDLLQTLAASYGPLFQAKRFPAGAGFSRISVFAGDEFLEDPRTRLADKLRPGMELSIALLRPLRGG